MPDSQTPNMARRPNVAQLAFCTPDLPATVRRFIEVFRFADAGGDVLWGDWLARMQDVGEDVLCSIWWLCSRQPFFQLEFFQHSVPVASPEAALRRPCDIGWVRVGVAVPDFDATLERLAGVGIETLTEPREFEGGRRVAYRDPDVGVIIEILEEGAVGPPQERVFNVDPTVVYAALSVSDLGEATRFLAEVVGFAELDPDALHRDEMEALWGLENARRERAAFAGGGGIAVEVVQYEDPTPAPRPAGSLIVDHGFSHAAFGFRDRSDLDAMAMRLEADGRRFTVPLGDPPAAATYLYGPDRIPLEILAMPRERDGVFGFAPREVKIRAAV